MEQVLVVPASDVGDFYGLNVNTSLIRSVADSPRARFLPRDKAEIDESYKQVIPYCPVVTCSGHVLTYTRGKAGGEGRLHDLSSIGLGGHVNPSDMSWENALIRELKEEIGLTESFKYTLAGVINENKTEVGRVHVGLLCIVLISDRSEVDMSLAESCIDNPRFVHWSELKEGEDDGEMEFELWSQIALDYICSVRSSFGFSSMFEEPVI